MLLSPCDEQVASFSAHPSTSSRTAEMGDTSRRSRRTMTSALRAVIPVSGRTRPPGSSGRSTGPRVEDDRVRLAAKRQLGRHGRLDDLVRLARVERLDLDGVNEVQLAGWELVDLERLAADEVVPPR